MRITILGGRGLMGSHLIPVLEESGHEVLVASRSSSPSVDLSTGEGLGAAIDEAEMVIHLASDPRKAKTVDLEGTRRLLGIMDGRHLYYLSIVGVDHHPFPYYRVKRQVEEEIETSGLPYTITRATQFHDFVAFLLGLVCKPPIATVPKGVVFQSIDTSEVATALGRHIDEGTTGRTPDLIGPEILGVEVMARSYMTAVGKERPLVAVPLPGRSARAFREGVHTRDTGELGSITWSDYLRRFSLEDQPPY